MSPAEVKKLEKKLERLEKKLDIVIERLLHADEPDWLDDPQLVKKLDEIAATEESISEKDVDL